MVSSTLCPAMHILGSQNVYGRAEGIADHYWPWAVFFPSDIHVMTVILSYDPDVALALFCVFEAFWAQMRLKMAILG